ncbi:MAG: energy transducer TonB [Vulcanimicrobiota bacterium]
MDNRFSKLVFSSLVVHLVVLAAIVAWLSRPQGGQPAEELVLRSVELEKAQPSRPLEPAPAPTAPPQPSQAKPRPRPTRPQSTQAPPPPSRAPQGFSRPAYPQARAKPTPHDTRRPRPEPVPEPGPAEPPASPAPTPAWTPPAPVSAPTGPSGDGDAGEMVTPARPLFIPELHLRDPNRKLVSVAVIFTVRPGGDFEVRLARSTGDAELDRQALEQLRKSRWRAKKINGKEVEAEVKAEVVNVP